MSRWNTILSFVFDTIFPSKCLECGQGGPELCPNCLWSSPLAERESDKWIFPIFDYRHPPIRKAVWLLKYNGRKNIANIFAGAMHGRILEELSDRSIMENFRDPILMPIPLSPGRHRERGFNQAELISEKLEEIDRSAGGLGARANLKMEKNILLKPKDTEHQARIQNRTKRLKNVVGSFIVKNNALIKGRNIILIDDVTTTGATLSEARKILKSAGARKIGRAHV